jgi:hypothetical protein
MMSPELYFALTLIVKMAVTAVFVVAATMTAERAGPLVGALVATLPLGAGPVYVFLALDHDAHFISLSALNSLAINTVNTTFAMVYAFLAQKRSVAVSVLAAMAVWAMLSWIVFEIHWAYIPALVLNIAVLGLCIALSRPLRHVRMPAFRARWTDLVMRAALVALLVGFTVTFSFQLGPGGSGIMAVFPVILLSIMFILHNRVGGKPAAAVLANTPLGLVGFAGACTVLHFTAEPLGNATGLTLALATSIGWSLLVLLARRRGIDV